MRHTGRIKKCLTCGKEFYAPYWLEVKNGAKYCSHPCYGKSKEGKSPWNKGIKGSMIENSGSFGSKESLWKGTIEEYKMLHYWVGKYFGKPTTCEMCNKEEIGKRIHWANISGEYKKQRGDWVRLCAKCHYKFDKTNERRNKNRC
jgi:hypothetical protein